MKLASFYMQDYFIPKFKVKKNSKKNLKDELKKLFQFIVDLLEIMELF